MPKLEAKLTTRATDHAAKLEAVLKLGPSQPLPFKARLWTAQQRSPDRREAALKALLL